MSFTKNEAIEMMHDNTAMGLRAIADHVEKFKLDWEDIVQLLREIGDEQEAQSMVVRLRDNINKPIDKK